MNFSLDQLNVLSHIAIEGSFSAAARRMGKTQSAVSTAVSNLEIDLGVTLFDRSSRVPRLTQTGQRFLLEAELILERCWTLESHSLSLSQEDPVTLRLAMETPYSGVMKSLQEFSVAYPYIDISIVSPTRNNPAEQVVQRDVDFSIIFSQADYLKGIEFLRIGTLVMTHVCRHDHPLAQYTTVSFPQLRGYRHIIHQAHHNSLPTAQYFTSTQTWHADNFLHIIRMCKEGIGWATLPKHLVAEDLQQGKLTELSLEAYPHTDWLVGVDLIWLKKRPLSQPEIFLKNVLNKHVIYEEDSRGNRTAF